MKFRLGTHPRNVTRRKITAKHLDQRIGRRKWKRLADQRSRQATGDLGMGDAAEIGEPRLGDAAAFQRDQPRDACKSEVAVAAR